MQGFCVTPVCCNAVVGNVNDAIVVVREALAELMAAGPEELGQAETVLELERVCSQAEAVACRAVAAFDASMEWATEAQARSAASWLTTKCPITKQAAKRQVKLGRACRDLPKFEEAWGQGSVSGVHVETVAQVRRFETEDLLERDESVLVKQAQQLRFHQFARAVRYWEQLANPERSERNAESQRKRRDVFLVPSIDDMWLGSMTLDPISGAIVSQELQRIEQELFEADKKDAEERGLGFELAFGHLRRTPRQRSADALVEMATRSASCPAGSRRPDPLFTVLVDYETMHGRMCQLAQGAAVTPGSLVRYLESADIERVVFGLGKRVEVSERARLFSGATRRALEVRDQECQHAFCDEWVDRCQTDHIQPFSEGGLTVQENGQLLCPFHHRLKSQRENTRPPPDG